MKLKRVWWSTTARSRCEFDLVAEAFNLFNRANVTRLNPVFGTGALAQAGFLQPLAGAGAADSIFAGFRVLRLIACLLLSVVRVGLSPECMRRRRLGFKMDNMGRNDHGHAPDTHAGHKMSDMHGSKLLVGSP
jgi:hypothetical protein